MLKGDRRKLLLCELQADNDRLQALRMVHRERKDMKTLRAIQLVRKDMERIIGEMEAEAV